MKAWLFSCSILLLFGSCDKLIKRPVEAVDAMHKESLASQDSMAAFDTLRHIDSALRVDSNKIDGTRMLDTLSAKVGEVVDTKNIHPDELVAYSKTLIGVPYKYGSTDPKAGFDCSGFITYVFNHFGIAVPRSSIDFTNVGKEIPVEASNTGDLILFTGTNPEERFVGHMGIIVSNTDSIRFIHSTSGKANGVTITPLNKYYKSRYVKTIRIFPQNDERK